MFMLGLLGTGHCIGMCGPLVVAIPTRYGRVLPHLLYNLGRITTYTAVGAVMGLIGGGFGAFSDGDTQSYLSTVAMVQVGFSVVAALFLLWLGLARIGFIAEPRWMAIPSPSKIPGFAVVRRDITVHKKIASAWLFGLLLGFLPCGLSYAAFARALAAPGALDGALMVFAFGLGTLPGLLAVGTGASGFFRRHRRLSDILSGMLMLGMAAALLSDAITGYLA